MTKDGSWRIDKVDRREGIVTAICDGEEYSFTLKGGKLFCLSEKRLVEEIFNARRQQLFAILKNDVNFKTVHGHSLEENERINSLKKFRCYITPDGKIKIVYKSSDKKRPTTHSSIDNAIRAQNHILENHFGGGETSEIIRIFANMEELKQVREVLFDWCSKEKGEIKRAAQILSRISQNLQRCRDDLKIEAFDQLESAAEFTDSLGRENPGMSLARTLKADEKLEQRIRKTQGIDRFVAQRKAALEIEKRQTQLNIIEAIFKLKIILNSGDNFFKNKKAIDQKLGQVLYLLQSVWANPYFEAIKEAKKDIIEAKAKASKAEFNLARKFIAGAIEKLSCIQ